MPDQDTIEPQLTSTDPDVDLSGPVPRITIRPRQTTSTPVDYDPFVQSQSHPQSQPQAREATTPVPVDYDPFVPASTTAQKQPTVDYQEGAPFATRVALERAANPEEAKLALSQAYGEGNYGQDEAGRWWVKAKGPNGLPRKTAVLPSGFLNAFENVGAGMVASATPMAGATLGAALGSPAGPFGMAIGAGLGAGGGYAIDQLVKYYQGLYDQSPQEVVKGISNEAAINTGMVGAIPLVAPAFRGIGNALRSWVGTTPTTQAMAERLTAEGARVPIKSVAPKFKTLGDKQQLRNAVMGDPYEQSNIQYIHNRFVDALKSSGMDDATIGRITGEAQNALEAPTTLPTGQAVTQAVQQRVGSIAAQAETSRQFAESQIRAQEQALRAAVDAPVGRLGQDVSQAIIGQRRQFGKLASRMYQNITDATGGAKFFPLDDTFQAAQKFVDLADPGLVPPYVRNLAARGQAVERAKNAISELQVKDPNAVIPPELYAAANDNMATFSEAHELRNNLRELMDYADLTRTPYMHKISDVEGAIDSTFSGLESSPDIGGDAARALKTADKMYAEGIKKFHNLQVRKLVNDARNGIVPDPELVAANIIRPGHTEAAAEILKMLPPDVKQRVAMTDLRNMVQDASYRGRDGQFILDGNAFLNQIDQRGGMTSLLYGPKQLADLRTLGKQIAALDGKIDVTNLPPSQIKNALQSYVQATKNVDEFVRGNPMAAFMSGKPQELDRAARILTMPGRESVTESAAQFLGPDSAQFNMLRQHALRELMRSSIEETPSRLPKISGPNLEKALSKYTARQQELLFPDGLADDLKEISKEAHFLFPPNFTTAGDMSMGMAARGTTLHAGPNIFNPKTWSANMKYVAEMINGFIADRPQVIRFLADAVRKSPGNARVIMGVLGRYIVNQGMMGPGNGRPASTPQSTPMPNAIPVSTGL